MKRNFFDFDSEEFELGLSDNVLINSDGDLMMRMSDNMEMDMDSGELHIIFSFGDE